MKYFTTILLLTGIVTGAIYDVYTENLYGKVVIERGDTVIVPPNHSLIKAPSYIKVKVCKTLDCRKNYISQMKHRYRTNGITVGEVR